MKRWTKKPVILALCLSAFLFLAGCSESSSPPEEREAVNTDSTPVGTSDCAILSSDLIQQVGADYQLVRNLALAGGKNLGMMEKNMNVPKPETFRTFAAAFEQLDVSTVEALPNFDAPAVAAASIRELAEKLEAALAQKDNLSDPAWAELAEFSKRRQNRQQSSVNYYLSQLGCQ